MKQIFPVLLIYLFLASCDPPASESGSPPEESAIETGFDSAMAVAVGADAYGMRRYVMALLKRGPNRDQDSATTADIQRGHLDNMVKWAEDGKLVLAGPYLDDFEIRGIYIFAVDNLEEARALVQTDPAIVSGRLEMELHEWYGSAALMKVKEIHDQIAKERI